MRTTIIKKLQITTHAAGFTFEMGNQIYHQIITKGLLS